MREVIAARWTGRGSSRGLEPELLIVGTGRAPMRSIGAWTALMTSDGERPRLVSRSVSNQIQHRVIQAAQQRGLPTPGVRRGLDRGVVGKRAAIFAGENVRTGKPQ
jgi:hypothetical protein